MARESNEEVLMRELCANNGIDYDALVTKERKGEKVKTIEMFFFGVPYLFGMHFFPNLTTLRIVNQSLRKIEGLDCCPYLEVVWFAECKIECIEGLSRCQKLKTLILYQNKITEIKGFEDLTELEVLWLNSNSIRCIKGLSNLRKLKDLNLADNKIKEIGNGLKELNNLEILNLSANNIRYIEDIVPVFSLQSLQDFSLSDPAHGPNPASQLCNYSTYILFHLPHLKRLDGRDMTHPHLRNVIQLVVFRKKQFYMVKLKYLEAVLEKRWSHLKQKLQSDVAPLSTRLAKLNQILKGTNQLDSEQVAMVMDRIKQIEHVIQCVTDRYRGQKQSEFLQFKRQKKWLEVELKTGGNVSLVKGSPPVAWYSAVVELVQQRLSQKGLQSLGFDVAMVTEVYKVINRSSRLRFNEAVQKRQIEKGTLNENVQQKEDFDYLFVVPQDGVTVEEIVERNVFKRDEPILLVDNVEHALKPILMAEGCSSIDLIMCHVNMDQVEGRSDDVIKQGNHKYFVKDQDRLIPEYLIVLHSKPQSVSSLLGDLPENDEDVTFSKMEENQSSIEELNVESLSIHCQTTCDESLKEVVLMCAGVMQLSPSLHSSLTNTTVINLSSNKITSTSFFQDLPNLVSLDLSSNWIHKIEGFKGLPKLQVLDVSWNMIKSFSETTAVLRKTVSSLISLDIRGNPWQEELDSASLRHYVIGQLKMLRTLNRTEVSNEESEHALGEVVASHLSLATIMSKARTNQTLPPILCLQSTADYLDTNSSMRVTQLSTDQSDWWQNVTSICANKQGLTQIKAIGKCSNLKWASFASNRLQSAVGLDECSQLEELSLDKNWIRQIDSLCPLKHLVKLSLRNNLISSLLPLQNASLVSLQTLDVSNNLLTSLEGIDKCSGLLELYCSGNRLTSMRGVLPLKKLSSLLIVDIHGNPIAEDAGMCKLYSAFHLSNLKVFNGEPLLSEEYAQAKEVFGGRLNSEFISEKQGHSQFNQLIQADFPHSGIRMVELQPPSEFSNLRSLNLEHNNLTSMSGLSQLLNLRVLCLNHNRVEGLVTSSSGSHQPVFPSLQVLHLGFNQLSSLVPLELYRIPTLRALFLHGNQLMSADGLFGLKNLSELVLDHNKIRSIGEQSFTSLRDLRVLHMEENRLRDLANIGWLTGLEKLFLGMNRIQEFSDLDELHHLSSLNEVSFISNPVARRLHYRTQVLCRLPNLLALDGVPVTEEERHRIRAMIQDQEPGEGYGVVQTASGPFLVNANMAAKQGPVQTQYSSNYTNHRH